MKDVFDNNFETLKELFSKEEISHTRKPRLHKIFMGTEKSWKKQTIDKGLKRVKYILICEAPAETGSYFYDTTTTILRTTVWNAFFPNIDMPKNNDCVYEMLANKHFLLIDSLPYSMKYKSAQRKTEEYAKLIECCLSWWINKLNEFKIDKEVKIAFGFKLNAMQIIKVTKGKLKIGNRTFTIKAADIAADGSGHTSTKKLKHIFKLPKTKPK